MKKHESDRIVQWFQKHVGLKGWRVQVLSAPLADGAFGECVSDVPYHSAKVWISPTAHQGGKAPEDEAHTLMHELLHAFRAECGIIDEGEPAEWATNQLASNLLRLYRMDAT